MVLEISGHAHIHRRKDLDPFHQHLLLHHAVLFCPEIWIQWGAREQSYYIEEATREHTQPGSNMAAREPLGSLYAARDLQGS